MKKAETNEEDEELNNPFNDFSFWLQLAYLDFCFEEKNADAQE